MKFDQMFFINVLLFIAIALLLYIALVKIGSDGAQCTLNPLVYGANQLQEANSKPISCQCTLFSDNPTPTLYFNHNSSWMEGPDIEVVDSVWDFGSNFTLDG